ncbi:hypothetical protein PZA11_003737 [Diplocarpon coronariae]|uniref:WKF domain-containing protein n=1 Tax=Diplocarpon coronariae TaxID=2795749 RepID=A0A218ZGQ7_9HELO|nr:hypothetical protein JHW43_004383 [Diplocarpon mali]OWP06346.1 hypothetical protein B2J93_5299 [Marssonina coronariae]
MLPASIANFAHIPAWRRLGLKLKSAQNTLSTDSTNDTTKRKRASLVDTPLKKFKTNPKVPKEPVTPQLARRKSVTFTPETKIDDGDSIKQLFNSWKLEQQAQDPSFEFGNSNPAFQIPPPPQVEEQVDASLLDEKERRLKRVKKSTAEKPSKAKSHKPKKIVKPLKVSSRPFLQYLRQYCESRDDWKFNKNHQNHLLKHAFNVDVVPPDHAHFLIEYVKGLQGGVRTRLRDIALEVKVKDQQDGVEGFPDTMAQSEKRQRDYEIALQEYVDTMTAVEVGEEVGYEEGVLLKLPDKGMQSRVAKRMRTERILATLAATPDRSGGQATVSEKFRVVAEAERELGGKEPTQSTARKRKQRTAVTVDSESSSCSSDGSSDDSSQDSAGQNEQDEESSSSSSSSSSSDSGGDSESEDSDESDSE